MFDWQQREYQRIVDWLDENGLDHAVNWIGPNVIELTRREDAPVRLNYGLSFNSVQLYRPGSTKPLLIYDLGPLFDEAEKKKMAEIRHLGVKPALDSPTP